MSDVAAMKFHEPSEMKGRIATALRTGSGTIDQGVAVGTV
jgi:hypothetical protein